VSSDVSGGTTLFEAVGGMPFFEALVGGFYDRVEADPVLRAVYPSEDLGPARHRLTLFLAQYWGGPDDYDRERGAPRLRMRHFEFAVGPEERDHWLAAMTAAVDDLDPGPEVREAVATYFEMAAEALRNRD
jgi:hemoglobin